MSLDALREVLLIYSNSICKEIKKMNDYNIAIKSCNLGKKYRIGKEKPKSKTIHEKIVNTIISPFSWINSQIKKPEEKEILWAIKDINFQIERGEVVGFIGHNGAGKSTLLKILSRITEPSEGYADIYGRLAALLEVGTGMHPELTGKENIYMNGTILGMKKKEIDYNYDEIIEFSGINKFLETPVKHYSSGMRVRLGFAIAAHLKPEILIVDEVLAVGDADFQNKCIGKMKDVAKGGRTVLFVSHNMAAIQNLCTRVCLISNGKIEYDGNTDEGISRYFGYDNNYERKKINERNDRRGNGAIRFIDININNNRGDKVDKLYTGQDIYIEIDYFTENNIKSLDVHITFYTIDGKFMFTCSMEANGFIYSEYKERGIIICRIPKLPLTAGTYSINLYSTYKGEIADWIVNTQLITVYDGDFYGTGKIMSHKEGFLVEHEWHVKNYS
jgi:lipopolysaccharide transport system ATP-binding protein